MKPLILKDLYMLQKAFKMILVLIVFYVVIFLLTGAGDALAMVLAILAVTFPISTFTYDEANKWDRYALSGPLERKDIVCAKYLLCLLLMGFALIFGLLGMTVMGFFLTSRTLPEILLIESISVLLGLLGQAIILPFIYKLGAERGRMLLIAVLMIPILCVILYSRFAPAALQLFVASYLRYLPLALVFMAAAGYVVSYRISLRIYMGKDF